MNSEKVDFEREHLRSLRGDLGICILLKWIQLLGCLLDNKSFRSLGADADRTFPKQKQKRLNQLCSRGLSRNPLPNT